MKQLLLILLRGYKLLISPILPPACRFHPSCSQYAEEAINRHGPLKGLWLSVKRVARCNPWSAGGHDPVP
ncbi:MAG: membrane protein insertion efficiency factor YidD [Sideroxyarcus sp.]|nr:membrane protein insertion efficiency factor YidD [Sideroxyarcus sp.]